MMAVRVVERRAIAVAIVAGAVATLAGARPTGRPVADAVVTGVSVGFVTWTAASAHWWMLAVVTGVSVAAAADPTIAVIGVVGLGGSLVIGTRRHSLGAGRAIVAGLGLNVLIRSELGIVFGLSAAVGMTAGIALVVDGLRRRRERTRLIGSVIASSAIGLAAVTTAALGLVLLGARDDVERAEELTRTGLGALARGDADAAQAAFTEATRLFTRVEDAARSPFTLPASLIPIASQHRDALSSVAARAASTSDLIDAELTNFDIGSLRVVDGAIDVDAVRAMSPPLSSIMVSLRQLQEAVDRSRGPWLLSSVDHRLATLSADVASEIRRGEDAAEALAAAPAMLGGDGPRTYLVAFLTPAEARGGVGFMGSLAEMSVVDGRLRIARYWNTGELNARGGDLELDGAPRDWMSRYGIYGFTGGRGGRTEGVAWSNVTLSPHFPSTAEVMRELYREGIGPDVDGVFALDVAAMAAILEITGPIEVPGPQGAVTLASDTIEQFLLVDQYRLSQADSQDLLEQVGRATLDALLEGELPAPDAIANSIGPAVRDGRLTAWSRHRDEQRLFHHRGMTGALPTLSDELGVAITVNNGNPSKIDTYLHVSMDVTVDISGAGDAARSAAGTTATFALTNSVTPDDLRALPDVVTGNEFDLPPGTNRSLVEVFTSAPIDSMTIDGVARDVTVGGEAGWSTSSVFVDIPRGTTVVVQIRFRDEVGDAVVVRVPPLVQPVEARVTVCHDALTRSTTLPTSGVVVVPL